MKKKKINTKGISTVMEWMWNTWELKNRPKDLPIESIDASSLEECSDSAILFLLKELNHFVRVTREL